MIDFLCDPIKDFFDLFVFEGEDETEKENEDSNEDIETTTIVDDPVLQNPPKTVGYYLQPGVFLVIYLLFFLFFLIFSRIDEFFDKTSKSNKNQKTIDLSKNDSCEGVSTYSSFYNEEDYNLASPRELCGKEGEKPEDLNYYDLLQHPKWKEKRLKILQRDNFQCVVCGYNKKLQIHHKRYKTDPKTGQRLLPWEYDDDGLVTLCDLHHRRIHGK